MVNWFALISYVILSVAIYLALKEIARNKQNPYRFIPCGLIMMLYGMFSSVFLCIILEKSIKELDLTPIWLGFIGFSIFCLIQVYTLTKRRCKVAVSG